MNHAIIAVRQNGFRLILFLACLCLIYPTSIPAEDDHDHEAQPAAASESTPGGGAGAHEGHDDEEGLVVLTPDEIQEFGIEIAEGGPGILHSEIVVPGEVVVNGDRLAHIAPRFPGVVTGVKKNIGDTVKTGDVLAVIESNEGLAPYQMKALMDGIIIDKHITIGEVNHSGEPAYIIADLDTVWVNLSIYQMHLSRVRVGQPVVLKIGEGLSAVEGKIDYLSPIVDEHTRAATARVILPSLNGKLRPGMFVEGRIRMEGIPVAIMVPRTAILMIDNETVVFIEDHEGFVRRDVEIGRQNETHVELVAGLTPGEKYVKNGGFILKAEMGKAGFGHDHAH